MSANPKSQITSKISKLDRDINLIKKMECSKELKEALVQIKKDKKKGHNRRLNKGLVKGGPKKVRCILDLVIENNF